MSYFICLDDPLCVAYMERHDSVSVVSYLKAEL